MLRKGRTSSSISSAYAELLEAQRGTPPSCMRVRCAVIARGFKLFSYGSLGNLSHLVLSEGMASRIVARCSPIINLPHRDKGRTKVQGALATKPMRNRDPAMRPAHASSNHLIPHGGQPGGYHGNYGPFVLRAFSKSLPVLYKSVRHSNALSLPYSLLLEPYIWTLLLPRHTVSSR